MNTKPPSDYVERTIEFYNHNPSQFCASTANVDMEPLYTPFLELIPSGGRILDAGCGSGRDSLAFLKRRYDVVSFDGSPAMAEATSRLTGRTATVTRFDEMSFVDEFDGIWACAALVHVAKRDMEHVAQRFVRALKMGGVWYVSFKEGTGEEERRGRHFTNFTASDLVEFATRLNHIEVVRIWGTPDARPDRANERWVNGILRKIGRDSGNSSSGTRADGTTWVIERSRCSCAGGRRQDTSDTNGNTDAAATV